ncbi:MAG: hypothetical protein SOZ07_08450 [Prevotella sp.]|nr:hypothetical protein [Prevotella sp.]
MGMIETIKEGGNVELSELNVKQIIALLNIWDTNYAKNENMSFSDMVKRCYKTDPWHENSPIIYIHSDEKTATTVSHGFSDLGKGEEEDIMRAIKAKIEDGSRKK